MILFRTLCLILVCIITKNHAAEHQNQIIPHYALTIHFDDYPRTVQLPESFNRCMYVAQRAEEEIAKYHLRWQNFSRNCPHIALSIQLISILGIGIATGMVEPQHVSSNACALFSVLGPFRPY